MGNKLVTRVRNVFSKKSKTETRSIDTARVKTVKARSIETATSRRHVSEDAVAETPSKLVEESVTVSALQVDHLGGLEVSLLDSLGNFSRNGSCYVSKPVSNQLFKFATQFLRSHLEASNYYILTFQLGTASFIGWNFTIL